MRDFMEFIDVLNKVDICAYEKNIGNIKYADKVFHYTSTSAAINILKTGRIRFSHLRFLNDPREISHGLFLAEKSFDHINTNIGSYHYNKNETGVLLSIVKQLRYALSQSLDYENILKLDNFEVLKSQYTGPELDAFVFSLSEKDDDLRQWIPYADDGTGVALGFNFEGSFPITEKPTIKRKIVYSDEDFLEDEIIKYYVDFLLNITKKIVGTDGCKLTNETFFIELYKHACTCLISSKDRAYADEKEFRLFYPSLGEIEGIDIDYQCTNRIIKPFIEFDFDKKSLIEIKLGPKCDPLNLKSLELLKKDRDYSFKISKSEIKYR